MFYLAISTYSKVARSFTFVPTKQRFHHHNGLLINNNKNIIRLFSATESEEKTTSKESSNVVSPVYDFLSIEKKWQDYWVDNKTFKTPIRDMSKPKQYILDMFPYPSGSGLHVGHPEGYTASDITARYYRMKGYDVLHPMGWDSFGLPAEQFAIQTGTPPEQTTKQNISTFKRQLKMLGFSYDWDKEIATTDISYVKWTQWIFLQLFKAGLAKQDSSSLVNWCDGLGTVLANEEVINGLSERGDFPVNRIPLRQWQLKITEYATQLEDGLKDLDWPQGTLAAQKGWIGRSEGCQIDFKLVDDSPDETITVFTTRPDTLMGVTYVTLAPEHPLVSKILSLSSTTSDNKQLMEEYVQKTSSKSDLERTANKEKTGCFTGYYASHPITREPIPIWISDYVLSTYGTGAVMAVPSHDDRDFEFATIYELEKKPVIQNPSESSEEEEEEVAYTGEGTLINSMEFDGLSSSDAKLAISEKLESMERGKSVTNFKLRDWVFSRQRYWGEPIPIYFPVEFDDNVDISNVDLREDDSIPHTIKFNEPIPVEESDLPLELPQMDDFKPGTDPAGCLARAKEWRYFQKEGKWFARETNTMPQWAGSCWYYLRFCDTNNDNEAFSAEADQSWMPVDLYIGGAEHAVLHLLYARFWHKVLYDLGFTMHKEPFQKLIHQGMILGTDGEKMSKSRGNVINPDEIVEVQGGDALRLYEMFMGPLDAVKPWQTSQVAGVVRFQNKVYNLVQKYTTQEESDVAMDEATIKILHKTMKKVTNDIEILSFNTAISALMVLTNHLLSSKNGIPKEAIEKLILMVSPFAPHLGEECWEMIGYEETLAYYPWVEYDEALCVDDKVKIGVQINGKVRGQIEIEKDADQDAAVSEAMLVEKVKSYVDGKDIKKIIYVPGRILNIVAK